ncbi:MAG: cell division ATP-binding protein FtsE [Patescibacteria group bacterium]|jgi:cell division transport system ATP-binding protein
MTEKIIEIKNLSKKYDNGTEALRKANLVITPREFITLVGPSGAGKSTIISLIVREDEPSEGEIFIAGRDICKLQRKEIPYYRRKVGVVYQDFKLLPQKTVFENISFALEVCDATDMDITPKVSRVIKLIGLEGKEKNYPRELSGGEKQRVAIGRAIVNSPKILIADEPTGNLDPHHTWEIINLLTRINEKGTVVILATHNKVVVDRLKKRVIHMKNGQIISDRNQGTYLI